MGPLTPARRWHAVRRLLAVRTDNLGDVLMTTPALHALKSSLRGVHLTLLTSPSGAAAVPHLPFVDDAIAVRAPWAKCNGPSDEVRALVERLRAGGFDAAVIFTTYSQSALPAATVAHAAGIPLRLAHCRENPYELLSDWVPEPEPGAVRHEVERQLALVAAIGVLPAGSRLRFTLHRDDCARARARLAEAGVAPGQPYLVVHPGATAPSRRYPPERYGRALALMQKQVPMTAIVVGGADDTAAVRSVVNASGGAPAVVTVTGIALGELAALIADAALVICNNSGPAHIAAAMRTPLVELYALTNPQHTPWGTPARVLYQDVPCRNCLKSVCPRVHHACLLGVSPEQVAQAAVELLTGIRPVPAGSLQPLRWVA